jgi:hypothetical protein
VKENLGKNLGKRNLNVKLENKVMFEEQFLAE